MRNTYLKSTLLEETVSKNVSVEMNGELVDFQELMLIYHSAIKSITTKLEILKDDLSHHYQDNPIQIIKSRVKEPKSIINKLDRQGKDISAGSIISSLNDVAGIRVIVGFVSDIYTISDMLVKQDDIILVETKDYFKNPKTNGYRSYHMIIEVPVFFSEKKHFVKVEIQIRTIAMDFWASLEHQLRYKKNIKDFNSIEIELKKCAEIIAKTNLKMMDIKNKLERDNG